MKQFLLAVLVLLWGFDSFAEPLPPEIENCITDSECEEAARILCAAGHDEWCIEVEDE